MRAGGGIQTVDSWEPSKAVHARGEDRLAALYNKLPGGTAYTHMTAAGNKFIADLLAQAVRDARFTATKATAPVASAPRTNRPVLGDKATIGNLRVTRNAQTAPDGTRTATLLEDESDWYGVISDDVPVADDGLAHSFSLDLRAGSSPDAQIQLQYLGGTKEQVFYAYVDTPIMTPNGVGAVRREQLGNGWYRLSLTGANNASGNKVARVSVYPRQPTTTKPAAAGSLYIADPRLDR